MITNPAAFGRGMGIVSPNSNESNVGYFFSRMSIGGFHIVAELTTGVNEVVLQRRTVMRNADTAVVAFYHNHPQFSISDPNSNVPEIRDATPMNYEQVMAIQRSPQRANAVTAANVTVYDVVETSYNGNAVLSSHLDIPTVSGVGRSVKKIIGGGDKTIQDKCREARDAIRDEDNESPPIELLRNRVEKRYTIVAKLVPSET